LLRHLDHELLPRMLAGEATGTVAIAGAAGEWVPNGDSPKTIVPDAELVDVVAIIRPGPEVVVAERPAVRHTPTMDWSRRLHEVDDAGGAATSFSDVALRDVVERATVGLAAEMLGATRWLFETTLAYAKARHQFGRPIGSFQAIQHKLANMKVELERAWSAVYYAAMTIDADDPDRGRAAHAAKIAAGDAVRINGKDAIQIHGGIGYTWEHDLHLYMRRAYASEHLLGTSEYHQDRLAELIF
jgi:alkylation response protein AidB-like acyl-CoA dehydrogenase